MTGGKTVNEAKTEDPEQKAKLDALIDNTAQGIFNYLKEVQNKREVYQMRWVWELLQNAMDAAPQDRKVDVKIIKENHKLLFRHNGRPFRPEEVAHLIYHGSTKMESDLGKFGTGFLVTHLLSKTVTVQGIREDGKAFLFPLNRDGMSAADVKNLMEDTWLKYQKSLGQTTGDQSSTAEYQYELDNVSLGTAIEGIETLIRIAPYVLAFNDKLGVIEVSNDGHIIKYALIEATDKGSYVRKIVKKEEEGKQPVLHEILIVEDTDIQAALKLENQGDGQAKVESLNDIPKLFVGFPLFGTQDLPYPLILNSRRFEPTERRDGIFLGKENTEYILRNKKLMERAKDLVVRLISNAEAEKWENVHALLNLGPPPQKDWLDLEWYTHLLVELLSAIMKLRVVRTESGNFITFSESLIPTMDNSEADKIESLWNVLHRVAACSDRLPAKVLTTAWAGALDKWKSLGINLSQREVTLQKFAEEIESSGDISGFKRKLIKTSDEFETLNDFYKLLLEVKRQVFDSRNILPNQNGAFTRKPALLRDTGIDEKLKDIALQLGKDIRSQLVHTQVVASVQDLLPKKEESEVLNEVLALKNTSLKDKKYSNANAELLSWVIKRGELDKLEGYPVQSQKEDTFILLSRRSKEKPLAPKEIWDERARNYAEIFPADFVISSFYVEKLSENEWKRLQSDGYILTEPLYLEPERLSEDDLESLLVSNEKLDEEKDHETLNEVTLSKLAFLEMKDRGVIDTVRKVKDKARSFLNFLFRYVVEKDSQWSTPIEVDCECGARHRIYPARWMPVLKSRQWVPKRKDGEKPSAQYLAPLVADDPGLLQICRQDKPSRLLNVLNVSISELMIHVAAKDEKTKLELDKAMGSLYSVFMENPSELSKLANLAEIDPLLFMQEIEERLSIRKQIRRNQDIGALVEALLKEALEKEGFKVDVTGVGSDFVLEHDYVKDDKEAIVEVKREDKTILLIEVKSTLQDFVRMTLTQAREARDKRDRYALCVVILKDAEITEQGVRDGARFVIDIGSRVQGKVQDAENLLMQQGKAATTGDIELEVEEGPVRLKIKKPIWETGKTFEEFVASLRQ